MLTANKVLVDVVLLLAAKKEDEMAKVCSETARDKERQHCGGESGDFKCQDCDW